MTHGGGEGVVGRSSGPRRRRKGGIIARSGGGGLPSLGSAAMGHAQGGAEAGATGAEADDKRTPALMAPSEGMAGE